VEKLWESGIVLIARAENGVRPRYSTFQSLTLMPQISGTEHWWAGGENVRAEPEEGRSLSLAGRTKGSAPTWLA